MKNNKLVPELRFGNFESTWIEGKVKDFVVFHNNKRTPISKIERSKMEKKHPYYGAAGIIDFVDFYKFEGDYVLYGEDGTLGKSFLTEGKFCVSNHAHVLKSKTSNIFLYQLLKNLNWKLYNTGTIQPKLNKIVFESVSLKMPESIKEQGRIASFLSNIDKRIKLLEQIKDLNKQYKKGLLQQMFVSNSAGGGVLNAPSLRFKGFEDDWKSVKLENLLFERKEYSIKGKGLEHVSLTKEGVVPKTERYNRDFLVTNDTTKKYKVVKKGDICYNPANLKFGVITLNENIDGIFSPIYVTFETKNTSSKFIGHLLTRKSFIQGARKYEEGTVYERKAVKPSIFINIPVFIPSQKEQEKIGNFLTQVDNNYNKLNKELETSKQWKKGLLQRMFV